MRLGPVNNINNRTNFTALRVIRGPLEMVEFVRDELYDNSIDLVEFNEIKPAVGNIPLVAQKDAMDASDELYREGCYKAVVPDSKFPVSIATLEGPFTQDKLYLFATGTNADGLEHSLNTISKSEAEIEKLTELAQTVKDQAQISKLRQQYSRAEHNTTWHKNLISQLIERGKQRLYEAADVVAAIEGRKFNFELLTIRK